MWFEGIAWAAGAQGPAAGGMDQVVWTMIVPFAMIFAIAYFLLIRPQTQKASEHQKMLNNLKRNEEVVTSGGILGKIVELGDRLVTLEVAPNVRIRIERTQIGAVSTYGKGTTSKKEQSG
ncbi:MAG TPA: preprotein translocase subunit YajC [Candidatus Binataceae bacterium]|nr:preprotein translocase subunit YajC [Candidatus Binataceae bacterium]